MGFGRLLLAFGSNLLSCQWRLGSLWKFHWHGTYLKATRVIRQFASSTPNAKADNYTTNKWRFPPFMAKAPAPTSFNSYPTKKSHRIQSKSLLTWKVYLHIQSKMTAMWRHRMWNSNEKKDRKTEMVCSFSGAVGIFFRLHSASFALYSKLQIELEPDLEYAIVLMQSKKKTMCLISTSNYIALRWLVSIRRTNQMETDVCMHQKCLVNVGLTRIGYIYIAWQAYRCDYHVPTAEIRESSG